MHNAELQETVRGFRKIYSTMGFFMLHNLFLIKYRISEFKSSADTKQNPTIMEQGMAFVSTHFSLAYCLH